MTYCTFKIPEQLFGMEENEKQYIDNLLIYYGAKSQRSR